MTYPILTDVEWDAWTAVGRRVKASKCDDDFTWLWWEIPSTKYNVFKRHDEDKFMICFGTPHDSEVRWVGNEDHWLDLMEAQCWVIKLMQEAEERAPHGKKKKRKGRST